MTDVTNPSTDAGYSTIVPAIAWQDILIILSFLGTAFIIYKNYIDDDDEEVDEEPTLNHFGDEC